MARAEFGLGGTLRRRGQVVNARPHLARAVELATTCGAHGLAGLSSAELRVAGGHRKLGITSRGELAAMWPRDSATHI